MMTARQFEKINGHTPTVARTLMGVWVASCTCDCWRGPMKLTCTAFKEHEALEKLLEAVYKHHGDIVMHQANWMCSNCKSVRGLESHHKVHRSKGRDDRVENLTAHCARCHTQAHSAGFKVRPADRKTAV